MTRARIAGLAVAALMVTLTAWNGALTARGWSGVAPIGRGDRAPAGFTVVRADTKERVGLEAFAGRVVLVDFWATWCGPCRQSMPALDRIYRKHRAEGFEVLSINTEGPGAWQRALRFAAELGLDFPVYLEDGRASELYRVETIPFMVLVDRKGTVRWVRVGSGGEADLERTVAELLRER